MKPAPPTSTKATPRDDARTPQPSRPTFGAMLVEVMDLSAGLVVALLPLLALSLPGIVLFALLPAILLLALAVPLAVIGAALALPPYLVARWLRRRRTTVPRARQAHTSLGRARPGLPQHVRR
jgi:hypothetical protein